MLFLEVHRCVLFLVNLKAWDLPYFSFLDIVWKKYVSVPVFISITQYFEAQPV